MHSKKCASKFSVQTLPFPQCSGAEWLIFSLRRMPTRRASKYAAHYCCFLEFVRQWKEVESTLRPAFIPLILTEALWLPASFREMTKNKVKRGNGEILHNCFSFFFDDVDYASERRTLIWDPVEFSLESFVQTVLELVQGSSHAFVHQIGNGVSVWHLHSPHGEVKRLALLQGRQVQWPSAISAIVTQSLLRKALHQALKWMAITQKHLKVEM